MELRGKKALVTGAGGAVGGAVAKMLAERGVTTVALDIASPSLELLAEGVEFRRCDVSSADDLEAILADLVAAGGVDILVNNVGVSPKKDALGRSLRIANTALEEWKRVLDINLTSYFLCIQALMPGMMARGQGRVVNIGSHVARSGGNTAAAHYTASKAGVLGLTKAAAKEAGPFGVTVNAVNPGRVASAMTQGTPEEIELDILRRIPLGRVGQPEDIAGAVLFLVSSFADYVTGTAIEVNGGMYMGP